MNAKMQATLAAALPQFNATSTPTPQSKYSIKPIWEIPLAASFELMPDSGYVRAPVVRALFGISNATMHRWILASRIPAPKKIGRTSLFQVGQLRACLEAIQLSGKQAGQEGVK